MTKTPPTTLREWLSEGGTEQQWYHLQRTERGLDRPAPPPWKPVLMLHEREQPSFPVDALPKPLRDFALGMACEQQTPVDLAATSALAVFSATLAQKIRVETRTSQPLPVNLFIANITQGTLGEECVIGEVRSPLERLELGNFDVWREPIAKRQSLRRQDKIRLRRLELLGVDSTRSRDEAIEFAAKLEMNPVPAMPQMIVDDTTRGKLDKILSQQNGRLAAFYGEGAILDLFTGTQSKHRIARRELFRRCHRSESFLVEQRAGANRTLVKDASITCQMAVPQWSIEGLHRHRSRRGRGVLDCFLFSMPKKSTTPRDLKQRATIPIEALQNYHDLIADGWRNKAVYTLKLSSEARDVFQLFENEVEGHLTRHPEETLFRAWLDRLPEQTLRIAGVLHSTALRSPNLEESPKLEEQIPVETMRAAVTIARYFIPHTEAAFAAMHCHWDDATDGARYLLDWFMSENVKTFTRREAHQRSRARFRQAWEIDAPLAELVRRGYIRPLPYDPTDKKTGRSASPRYEVQTEIYYIHRHPAYSFGEIGAPVTLAELDVEASSEHKPHAPRAHEEQTPNPGAMPSSSSACEAKSKPEVNSEHDRRQSAQQDQGKTPTPNHSEHERRAEKQEPPGGDIAAPFKKRSEDKRRQRNKKRLCDAPSVKEFKKKNPHLLKMYLEQIKPLLEEHGMSDDRRPS